MREVNVTERPLSALTALLPPDQVARLRTAAEQAAGRLTGRTIWNISSTATGGGVAEMLQNLLGYFRGAGVDARWLVLDGDPEFFASTKKLHNAIHGVPGHLTESDHENFRRITERNVPRIEPGDIVLLHDPQSAGLVNALRRQGARVAWRSHIGRDTPNAVSEAAWEFLRRYIADADAFVFSRRQHVPVWVPPDRLWLIAPSIDPLSPKNRSLTQAEAASILADADLTDGSDPAARLVVQVSRWDRLKDMGGVMEGFLQCHAAVIVQKSLAEGSGLTVAEGMWKSRPLIASAVGGIQDQISTEWNGLAPAGPRRSRRVRGRAEAAARRQRTRGAPWPRGA